MSVRALFLVPLVAGLTATLPQAQSPCDLDRVFPSVGSSGDDFGEAVAVSGNRILVGAPGDDALGDSAGAAYVYELVGGVWQESRLESSDGVAGDNFGITVAIDGDVALVGAVGDTVFGANSGSAYVFENVGGTWTEVQKLNASNGQLGDLYGISVSVQGDRLVVGACQVLQFLVFGTGNGKLFVYERSGATWTEDVILTASDGAPGDRFGVNHDIDGDTLLISAENKNIFGPESGAAYLFEKVGGVWTELDRIEPSDGAGGDFFSFGLALDGDFVACGAPEHSAGAAKTGAVYVFERAGNAWSQTQKLVLPGAAAQDWFGRSVDLEGAVVWAGAHRNDFSSTGAAHAYAYDGASWNLAASVVASDAVAGDQHGYSLAVDGDRLVVASRKDGGVGSVYEYPSTLASVTTLGCDLNPAGSLAVLGGTSSLGDALTFELHNPSGTQTPGATLGFLAICNQPLLLPNQCGVPFAWDMTGGTSGELAVDPGTLLSLPTTSIWAGAPVSLVVPMPSDCALVGTDVAVQGVMFDGSGLPGVVKFGLTRAVSVTLGL